MQFEGASLRSREDIKASLDNYKRIIGHIRKCISTKISEAEKAYTYTWWDKVWNQDTLKGKYTSDRDWWDDYEAWCYREDYILFNNEEESLLRFMESWGDVSWTGNYYFGQSKSIKKLYGKGNPCYLNPEQCYFVDKFKEVSQWIC